MKVYNWKNLWLTVLGGGAGIVYACFKMSRDGAWGIPWLIIWGILIVQGLKASLTEKGFRKDTENKKNSELAYRTLFGKFARIMQYGPLLCFGLGGALLVLFPTQIWFGMCFIIGTPVFEFLLYKAVRREKEREKKQQ